MKYEKHCFRCGGKLTGHTQQLRARFGGGVERDMCDACGDGANSALSKSRAKYGVDNAQWKCVMIKFKIKHRIPLSGKINAAQQELVTTKWESLLKLMFITDVRSVRKYIESGK